MGANLASVDLGPGRTAVAVSAAGHHSCCLLDDASVKCWGYNGEGQLGQGDTSKRGASANETGTNLASVDLGDGRTAVADDATVKCWGMNTYGQLGQGDTSNRGDEIHEMGANLTSVALGPGRTADDATLKCWGATAQGQIGLGDTSNRGASADEMGDHLPAVEFCAQTCATGSKIVAIFAGKLHSCALLNMLPEPL
ncbi:regulator of chromosome condensation 1/beta-lactamase-inhibitor protein II [Baffinella frigidus]|nr:regulator of chromosome condensation 1/beta-lactamase-inhibitor protein II [Cryptophyta sp. CCMP2293]